MTPPDSHNHQIIKLTNQHVPDLIAHIPINDKSYLKKLLNPKLSKESDRIDDVRRKIGVSIPKDVKEINQESVHINSSISDLFFNSHNFFQQKANQAKENGPDSNKNSELGHLIKTPTTEKPLIYANTTENVIEEFGEEFVFTCPFLENFDYSQIEEFRQVGSWIVFRLYSGHVGRFKVEFEAQEKIVKTEKETESKSSDPTSIFQLRDQVKRAADRKRKRAKEKDKDRESDLERIRDPIRHAKNWLAAECGRNTKSNNTNNENQINLIDSQNRIITNRANLTNHTTRNLTTADIINRGIRSGERSQNNATLNNLTDQAPREPLVVPDDVIDRVQSIMSTFSRDEIRRTLVATNLNEALAINRLLEQGEPRPEVPENNNSSIQSQSHSQEPSQSISHDTNEANSSLERTTSQYGESSENDRSLSVNLPDLSEISKITVQPVNSKKMQQNAKPERQNSRHNIPEITENNKEIKSQSEKISKKSVNSSTKTESNTPAQNVNLENYPKCNSIDINYVSSDNSKILNHQNHSTKLSDTFQYSSKRDDSCFEITNNKYKYFSVTSASVYMVSLDDKIYRWSFDKLNAEKSIVPVELVNSNKKNDNADLRILAIESSNVLTCVLLSNGKILRILDPWLLKRLQDCYYKDRRYDNYLPYYQDLDVNFGDDDDQKDIQKLKISDCFKKLHVNQFFCYILLEDGTVYIQGLVHPVLEFNLFGGEINKFFNEDQDKGATDKTLFTGTTRSKNRFSGSKNKIKIGSKVHILQEISSIQRERPAMVKKNLQPKIDFVSEKNIVLYPKGTVIIMVPNKNSTNSHINFKNVGSENILVVREDCRLQDPFIKVTPRNLANYEASIFKETRGRISNDSQVYVLFWPEPESKAIASDEQGPQNDPNKIGIVKFIDEEANMAVVELGSGGQKIVSLHLLDSIKELTENAKTESKNSNFLNDSTNFQNLLPSCPHFYRIPRKVDLKYVQNVLEFKKSPLEARHEYFQNPGDFFKNSEKALPEKKLVDLKIFSNGEIIGCTNDGKIIHFEFGFASRLVYQDFIKNSSSSVKNMQITSLDISTESFKRESLLVNRSASNFNCINLPVGGYSAKSWLNDSKNANNIIEKKMLHLLGSPIIIAKLLFLTEDDTFLSGNYQKIYGELARNSQERIDNDMDDLLYHNRQPSPFEDSYHHQNSKKSEKDKKNMIFIKADAQINNVKDFCYFTIQDHQSWLSILPKKWKLSDLLLRKKLPENNLSAYQLATIYRFMMKYGDQKKLTECLDSFRLLVAHINYMKPDLFHYKKMKSYDNGNEVECLKVIFPEFSSQNLIEKLSSVKEEISTEFKEMAQNIRNLHEVDFKLNTNTNTKNRQSAHPNLVLYKQLALTKLIQLISSDEKFTISDFVLSLRDQNLFQTTLRNKDYSSAYCILDILSEMRAESIKKSKEQDLPENEKQQNLIETQWKNIILQVIYPDFDKAVLNNDADPANKNITYNLSNPLNLLLAQNQCNASWGGKRHISMRIYECQTCNLNNQDCCCSDCAVTCHFGHHIVFKHKTENAYCDCSIKSKCMGQIQGSIFYKFRLLQLLLKICPYLLNFQSYQGSHLVLFALDNFLRTKAELNDWLRILKENLDDDFDDSDRHNRLSFKRRRLNSLLSNNNNNKKDHSQNRPDSKNSSSSSKLIQDKLKWAFLCSAFKNRLYKLENYDPGLKYKNCIPNDRNTPLLTECPESILSEVPFFFNDLEESNSIISLLPFSSFLANAINVLLFNSKNYVCGLDFGKTAIRGHIFSNGMESFPLGLGSLADLFSGNSQKSTHDLDLFLFKLCSPEVITRGYNKNKFQKNSHLSNLFCRIMKFYSKIVDNNNNNLSNDKDKKVSYEIYNKTLVSVADSISRILGMIFSVPCHPLALGVKFGLMQVENGDVDFDPNRLDSHLGDKKTKKSSYSFSQNIAKEEKTKRDRSSVSARTDPPNIRSATPSRNYPLRPSVATTNLLEPYFDYNTGDYIPDIYGRTAEDFERTSSAPVRALSEFNREFNRIRRTPGTSPKSDDHYLNLLINNLRSINNSIKLEITINSLTKTAESLVTPVRLGIVRPSITTPKLMDPHIVDNYLPRIIKSILVRQNFTSHITESNLHLIDKQLKDYQLYESLHPALIIYNQNGSAENYFSVKYQSTEKRIMMDQSSQLAFDRLILEKAIEEGMDRKDMETAESLYVQRTAATGNASPPPPYELQMQRMRDQIRSESINPSNIQEAFIQEDDGDLMSDNSMVSDETEFLDDQINFDNSGNLILSNLPELQFGSDPDLLEESQIDDDDSSEDDILDEATITALGGGSLEQGLQIINQAENEGEEGEEVEGEQGQEQGEQTNSQEDEMIDVNSNNTEPDTLANQIMNTLPRELNQSESTNFEGDTEAIVEPTEFGDRESRLRSYSINTDTSITIADPKSGKKNSLKKTPTLTPKFFMCDDFLNLNDLITNDSKNVVKGNLFPSRVTTKRQRSYDKNLYAISWPASYLNNTGLLQTSSSLISDNKYFKIDQMTSHLISDNDPFLVPTMSRQRRGLNNSGPRMTVLEMENRSSANNDQSSDPVVFPNNTLIGDIPYLFRSSLGSNRGNNNNSRSQTPTTGTITTIRGSNRSNFRNPRSSRGREVTNMQDRHDRSARRDGTMSRQSVYERVRSRLPDDPRLQRILDNNPGILDAGDPTAERDRALPLGPGVSRAEPSNRSRPSWMMNSRPFANIRQQLRENAEQIRQDLSTIHEIRRAGHNSHAPDPIEPELRDIDGLSEILSTSDVNLDDRDEMVDQEREDELQLFSEQKEHTSIKAEREANLVTFHRNLYNSIIKKSSRSKKSSKESSFLKFNVSNQNHQLNVHNSQVTLARSHSLYLREISRLLVLTLNKDDKDKKLGNLIEKFNKMKEIIESVFINTKESWHWITSVLDMLEHQLAFGEQIIMKQKHDHSNPGSKFSNPKLQEVLTHLGWSMEDNFTSGSLKNSPTASSIYNSLDPSATSATVRQASLAKYFDDGYKDMPVKDVYHLRGSDVSSNMYDSCFSYGVNNGRNNGSGESSRWYDRLVARQDYLSYALSLMRAQTNSHQGQMPVVTISTFKHLAYIIDGFINFRLVADRILSSLNSKINYGDNNDKNKNQKTVDRMKRPPDMTIPWSEAKQWGDIPLAQNPRLLSTSSTTRDLFFEADSEINIDQTSFIGLDLKKVDESKSEADNFKPENPKPIDWSHRWNRIIDIFTVVFQSDVALEEGSIYQHLANTSLQTKQCRRILNQLNKNRTDDIFLTKLVRERGEFLKRLLQSFKPPHRQNRMDTKQYLRPNSRNNSSNSKIQDLNDDQAFLNDSFHKIKGLRVKYEGEAGEGNGVTRSFQSHVAEELCKNSLDIFKEGQAYPEKVAESEFYLPFFEPVANSSYYVPVQNQNLKLSDNEKPSTELSLSDKIYVTVGRLFGIGLLNDTLVPLRLSRPFVKLILYQKITIYDLAFHDLEKYQNFVKILQTIEKLDDNQKTEFFETLCLDFTITDSNNQESVVSLLPNEKGSKTPVTAENFKHYLTLYLEFLLIRPYKRAADMIRAGVLSILNTGPSTLAEFFSDDINSSDKNKSGAEILNSLTPECWSLMLTDDVPTTIPLRRNRDIQSSSNPSISEQERLAQQKLDKKAQDDANYKNAFWEILAEFNQDQLSDLLYFWTGSPILPITIGDYAPHINLRHREYENAAPLPTANTCINRMYLPRYKSKEMLREKLLLAIRVKNFGFI